MVFFVVLAEFIEPDDSLQTAVGVVSSCTVINDTTWAVLSRTGHVRILNPFTQKVLHTFREGKGPLEFEYPTFAQSYGGVTSIYDEGRRRIVLVKDGEYAGNILMHSATINSLVLGNPGYGMNADGIFQIDAVSSPGDRILVHDYAGKRIHEWMIGPLFASERVNYNLMKVYVHENTLVLFSSAVPVFFIFDISSGTPQIRRVFIVDGGFFENRIARYNEKVNGGDAMRVVSDVFIADGHFYVHMFGMVLGLDLSQTVGQTDWFYTFPAYKETPAPGVRPAMPANINVLSARKYAFCTEDFSSIQFQEVP